MTQVLADLNFALRLLRKSKAFTLAAVGTLALGIGANTAIFSVVYGMLLKPLPYKAPHELVMVWQDLRAKGGPPDEWASPGNLVDWRAQSTVFESMASIRGWAPALSDMGDAEMLSGELVSQSYFDVLGAQPVRGRVFRPEEAIPNAPLTVIISYRFWQDRLGGSDDVLSRQITLAGQRHQIVGVMPPEFRAIVNTDADVWRPDRLNLANPSRGAVVLRVIARLQPSVSVDQARTAMATVATDLARRYPESNSNVGITITPLHERIVGNVRPGLLVLAGAVLLVLLIACVNMANLLLARASGRSREMAVRMALGAGRGRVVRQLLTESLVVASIGGTAGILLSYLGVKAFVALAPAGTPRVSLEGLGLDLPVLAMSAGLTVLTGLLFGLAPAMTLARGNHASSLKDGGRGTSSSAGQGLRRALVVAEIAIAMILLVGGGLLLRSFVAMQRADLGFDPRGVVAGFVQIPFNRFNSPDEAIAFKDRVLDRSAAIHGVSRAAWTSILPLAPGGDNDMDFAIEGVPPTPPGQPGTVAWYRIVSADYLNVMGVRIISGRLFEGREPMPSVVISQALALRYWPGSDPVGRRIRFGGPEDGAPWFTILGIVDDVKQQGARASARGQVFIPYWHAGPLAAGGMNIVLETELGADQVRQALTQVMRDIDPRLPVTNVSPMTGLIARTIEEPRFLAVIATVFGILSAILAAVGVYGVIAYAVNARQQEIGVRLALGATRGDVFRLVFADGSKLLLIGIGAGVIGAILMAPAIQTLLYGVEPLDPVTFVAMCACIVVAAAAAILLPASRAARLSPATTLRD